MVGHDEKLSRKHKLAIAHMLTASSIAEDAQLTGIVEQTFERLGEWARTVLDTAIKAVELEDLETRIAILEQQLQHT